MKKLLLNLLFTALMVPWITQAQTPTPATLPYTCGFEDDTENANWTIVNSTYSTAVNKFYIDTAVHNGGTKSLYISDNNGNSNSYTLNKSTYAYAYREITVANAGIYTIAFDWKCGGESTYDFLRVFLIPDSAAQALEPCTSTGAHTGVSASTSPNSWIAVDNNVKLNLQSSAWQSFLSDELQLTSGTYKLVFYWRNDGSGGTQPPAAVDNIVFSEVACPKINTLNVTSVGAYSATISWTATTANTFAYVNDTMGAPRQWSIDAIPVNTNSVILTDLTPNTFYTFYLQNICGSDTSTWISINFHTSCLSISDDVLPYHESFENWSSGNFDPCYVASNTSTVNYPSVNTSYHSDSLKSLYLYSTASYATWLAFPAFESDINSLQVSFDIYKTTVTDYPLLVGVMSDRNDISTFDTITTVRCDEANTWQHFNIPLSLYEGNGLYIAFVSPNGVASSNYIDNIVVDNLSACPDPLNVEISNIGETSITLEWQSTGASNYIVEYGESGFIPAVGIGNIGNASGESFIVSGLTGNTAYDLYFRSDCSGDTGNWIGPLTFRTACPDVIDINTNAYTENFESYTPATSPYSYAETNELPNCWNFWTDGTNGSTGAYFPRVYSGTAGASPTISNNNLQMCVMNYTGTTAATLGYVTQRGKIKIATLPAFSEPLSNVTISFEAKTTVPSSTNAYNDTIFVAIATTDSTYIPLTYFTTSEDVIVAEVDLSQYESLIPTSGNARLALVFKAGSFSSSTVRYCGIDNVVVMKTPNCKKPYDGAITDVTPTTATYIFTDSINTNNYEIIWNTVNNIEYTLTDGTNYTTATDTTGEITNLEPATTYYAWVRSVCPGEYSSWIELGNFTTECYSLDTLPLLDDFDSYVIDIVTSTTAPATYPNHALPPCWNFINMSQTSGTYPQVFLSSSATYNPDGGKGLFFKSSNTTPIYAILPKVDADIEDLQLTFSYRNESVSAANGTLWVGVMTDPNNDSTFIELEAMPQVNEVTNAEYTFFADTMTGTDYYIAFRYTGGTANNYYLSINNISVHTAPACRRSLDLTATNISPNSADLTWANGSASSYIVAYSVTEGFNPDTCTNLLTSTTESLSLTGLTEYTNYYFAVKAICGLDSGAWSQVATFRTTIDCNGLDFVEPIIGNIAATTSSATYPFYGSTSYPRGVTWQLYTQEELEEQAVYYGNLISAIAYQYTATANMNNAPIKIYMAEVDINRIDVTDTIALDSMTLVFNGTHTFSNDEEWSSIVLDSPFNYSGTRNLMVAVERTAVTNVAGSFKYTAGSSTDYLCVYSYTNTSGSKSAIRTVNRSNIRFSLCTNTPQCERPDSVVVSNIQTSQVDVAWVGNAATYEVAYGLRGFDLDSTNTYQVVTGITTNNTTLTNLIDGEYYDVYVRGNCTQPTSTSQWSYVTLFNTPCLPLSVPYIEDFDSYTTDVVTSSTPPNSYPNHRIADCWNLLNLSSTTGTYPQAFLSAHSNYVLSGNCLFFRSKSLTPVYAVLPKMNVDIDSLQIIFSYRNEGATTSNGTLCLGVMTDPNNPSTFIELESYVQTTSLTTVEHLFGFDTVSGDNYYIVFRYTGGTNDNYYLSIDSVVVDYMPTCPRPIALVANNITETGAELSWTGNAANWIIEYGPAGFELGTGTTLTSNTNSLTLTGLIHSTRYDYYVRGICSANDTSDWSLDACTFRTECGIVSIPWSADLDGTWYYYPNNNNNARFPSCWDMVNGGSATYNWRNTTTASNIRSGSYAIYYSSTSSSTILHDDWLITPELQLTGNEQLVFWIKNPSTSNPSTSYVYESRVAIYAYTVDANDSVVTTDDFTLINPYITLAPGVNQYQEQIVPLTGLTGNVRLAFVVDTSSYSFYIDDIVVEAIPSCPKPRVVTTDSISHTAIELSWQSNATDFIVEYKRSVDSVWNTPLTGISTNSVIITGLVPSTYYDFRVRAVCSTVDTSEWSNILQECTLCGVISLPFYENFNITTFPANCWERMSGLAFSGAAPTTSSSYITRITTNNGIQTPHAKINIYGTTVKAWLITPQIDLANESGAELTFDLALTDYNNADTIEVSKSTEDDKFMVIISRDGGNTWLRENATVWSDLESDSADYSYRGIRKTAQQITIDLSQYYGDTIKIAFYGESTVSGGDNDLHIDNILVQTGCPAPAIASIIPDATTATITWTADATNFQVAYKEESAAGWSTEVDVINATTYTFGGLLPETPYQFRVRAICNEGEYSGWITGTFTTLVLPCIAPTNITATEITDNSAVIGWEAQDNHISWEVRYATQGQDTTVVATTNPITISNLYYGQTYQVWVRAFCGADTYSDWSEPISFNTLSCAPISNLTVPTVGNDNATLTWTAEVGQTEWEVSYGPEGFSEGNGIVESVSNTLTYQITGLESGIKYDAYVRAKCGEGFYSAWSPKVTFTTTVGINTASADNVRVQIYPNPANSEATVSVDGVNGKVEFVVADMNGRMIVTETINCEGSLVKTIDVSNLAKGAYFVHIYNDNFNTTRKLIVK